MEPELASFFVWLEGGVVLLDTHDAAADLQLGFVFMYCDVSDWIPVGFQDAQYFQYFARERRLATFEKVLSRRVQILTAGRWVCVEKFGSDFRLQKQNNPHPGLMAIYTHQRVGADSAA